MTISPTPGARNNDSAEKSPASQVPTEQPPILPDGRPICQSSEPLAGWRLLRKGIGSDALYANDAPTAVEALRASGLSVCKPDPNEKMPLHKGWSAGSLEPGDYASGDQVGILAGPLSDCGKIGHALVIIDLDTEDALRYADGHLPATAMMEGRASKLKSHRYYLTPLPTIPIWAESLAEQASKAAREQKGHPGPFIKSFSHRKTGKEVIRFLGTGGQCVAPPSVHPSGEVREWEGGYPVEPAVVDFPTLWAALCSLASACECKIPEVMPRSAPPQRVPRKYRGTGVDPVVRASKYLAKMNAAISGCGGHNATLAAARVLVWGFDLSQEVALRLLRNEFNPRCEPQWTDRELKHKVEDANRMPGDKPRGWLLDNTTSSERETQQRGHEQCRLGVYPRPSVTPTCTQSEVNGEAQSDEKHSRKSVDSQPMPPESITMAALKEAMFDPFRLGRLLIERELCIPTQLYFRGEWWIWRNNRYEVVSADDFKKRAWIIIRNECERIYEALLKKWESSTDENKGNAPTVPEVSDRRVSGAIQAAAAMCRVESETVWPVMLSAFPCAPDKIPNLVPDPNGRNFIAVANGLIDVEELTKTGRITLQKPTPLYFTPSSLPVQFDAAADCPKFLTFLARVTDNDTERQAILQEIVGYLLWFDTRQQTFFVLTGDGGNGKSTFLAVIRALIGDYNISSVPLEVFGERFQLTATLGKLVNAVAECGEMDRVAEAILKSFVGGDMMWFDRKGISGLNARPTARLLLSCNTLPRFTDRTNGVWRRYQVVPFTVQITESEKVKGMDLPEFWAATGEMSGILNWALCGLLRLHTQGGFTVSGACEDLKAEHRDRCDPHRQFIDDYTQAATNGKLRCEEVYAAYSSWCHERAVTRLQDGNFGVELRKVHKKVKRTRPREGKGRVYTYEGLGWLHGRPDELLTDYFKKYPNRSTTGFSEAA